VSYDNTHLKKNIVQHLSNSFPTNGSTQSCHKTYYSYAL